ncbi:MltR family transcriptional regulator [Glaesserella sp.]|uniref:MltR family transcriptional regulator n=1 Tax=Glaesserella sp. TaxID=2094731 RepID=UPI0035A10B35
MLSQDNFIEQLNEVASLRGFLALSTNQLAEQVERLIQRVFRKTDFALKSVVDSLFEHQGPLAELPVRLKLLLGLGVISAELYEDINAFLDIKIRLSDEVEEHSFASPFVMQFSQKLHHIDLFQVSELSKLTSMIENKDSMQRQMQQLRIERVMRSSLILAVTKMLDMLDVESPL